MRPHDYLLLVLSFGLVFDVVDCSLLIHHLYYSFCSLAEDGYPALFATLYLHVWPESVFSVCNGLCSNKVMVSLFLVLLLISFRLLFVRDLDVIRAWISPEYHFPLIQADDVMYCFPFALCLVAYLPVYWQQTWHLWLLSFSGMSCAMRSTAAWIFLFLWWMGQEALGEGCDARISFLRRLSLSGSSPCVFSPQSTILLTEALYYVSLPSSFFSNSCLCVLSIERLTFYWLVALQGSAFCFADSQLAILSTVSAATCGAPFRSVLWELLVSLSHQ